jgi:hypothetical protein
VISSRGLYSFRFSLLIQVSNQSALNIQVQFTAIHWQVVFSHFGGVVDEGIYYLAFYKPFYVLWNHGMFKKTG